MFWSLDNQKYDPVVPTHWIKRERFYFLQVPQERTTSDRINVIIYEFVITLFPRQKTLLSISVPFVTIYPRAGIILDFLSISLGLEFMRNVSTITYVNSILSGSLNYNYMLYFGA